VTSRTAHEARFFLVRHGRTAGNAERYMGWSDEPLNETGHREAATVRAALEREQIAAIYASPFLRTMDTARPLAAALGLEIEPRDTLREINFGRYQGLSKVDHPLKVRFDYATTPIPGGESLADVARRSMAFMEEIAPRLRAGETIAVVSHFWTSRVLVGSLLKLPIETMLSQLDYKPATGSVLTVDCCIEEQGDILIRRKDLLASPQDIADEA
jgi:broad specificity phosphatase PhoE